MSTIRKSIAAITRRLAESAFFADVPTIPVIPNDAKDLLTRIQKAQSATGGAYAVVGFDGGRGVAEDMPGPELRESRFFVEVTEMPTIWRARPGRPPTVEEMAEAVLRLLHLTPLVSPTGQPIPGVTGVLRLAGGMGEPVEIPQGVSIRVPFFLSLTFDQSQPPLRMETPAA